MSNRSAVQKVLTIGIADIAYALDHVREREDLGKGTIELTPASFEERVLAWKVLKAVKEIVQKELK